MGLVAGMGMTDNMLLKSYRNGKGPFVDRSPARRLANKLVEKLGIVTPGIETPVRLMSGGNVQKGAAGPGDRVQPEPADHRLPGARPGHQLQLHHLRPAEPAERRRAWP